MSGERHDGTGSPTIPTDFSFRTFVDHQLALDRKALTFIDAALYVVKNPQLENRLHEDRVAIADRVRAGEALQKTLRPWMQ